MPELNVVVDLSHHNASVDFVRAGSAGILGVIHKATQGTHFTDARYTERRPLAAAAGLMWGAYHFGVAGDVEQQVDHFLAVVKPQPGDLLVLDFEENTAGDSMTLAEAEAFVTRLHDKTGRWPGLYGGQHLKQLLGAQRSTPLASCWLWLAQYSGTVHLPAAWSRWTMWQYTDGAAGPEPHIVDGIGACDRDRFNGDLAALRELWGHAPIPAAAASAVVARPASVAPRDAAMPESIDAIQPKRPSWWRRSLIGEARVARLNSDLNQLKDSLVLRRDQVPQDRKVHLEGALAMLGHAQRAMEYRDLNTGWALVHEAERESTFADNAEELLHQADRLREEVREKLGGWRQHAALRALGDAGSVPTVEAVREALRIRNEHSHNLYHKFDLAAGQVALIGLLLLGGVLAILIASWLGAAPLGVYTLRLGWAALLGGVGGLLSAARGLAQGTQRKIPEQIADWPVTLVRPVLGATAGVGACLLVTAGMVSLGAGNEQLAPLIAAFTAGFSERYFLSILPSGEK